MQRCQLPPLICMEISQMCIHFAVVGGLIQYNLHARVQRMFHLPTRMPTELILKGSTHSYSESVAKGLTQGVIRKLAQVWM